MGYDLYITRGDWWEDEGRIEPSEWHEVVDGDDRLVLTPEISATTPTGDTVAYRSELLAYWTAHPDGTHVPLDYRDGRIVAKNPDDHTIEKMIEIATALDAQVQGDEGELYPQQG